MANPICTDPVCDTTVAAPAPPVLPVPTPTCGLPTNRVFTNATITTNASGCISAIESGDPFLYTPDPCCPSAGTGTGGGGAGLDGPQGDPGDAATVTVGAVTTGAAGSSAVVTNSGTNTHAILNFTIPAGNNGLDGATPSGLTVNDVSSGFEIQDGLVQSLPVWWPPLTSYTNPSVTSNGITLVFSKNVDGSVNVTLDASGMAASYTASDAARAAEIAALTTSLTNLQTNHNNLQTAHDTLKARVDAAGIP